ncbi:MAG: hypothetical protein Q4D59_02495 [Erysipelotrichaceae bacterium]|nr:hypothetical protein [Erysipelotrichaceae bacterium]
MAEAVDGNAAVGRSGRIRSLDLSEKEKEMILGLNTYKLYFETENANNAESC